MKMISTGRMLNTAMLALLACVMLAACGARKDRVTFNGVYYKAKAKPASDDRQSFALKVPRVDRGLPGALEAGRYEATRYCIENFGTSELRWAQGPDGVDGTLPLEGNTLNFTGRCVTW
ncbi:MAG: hypothetical protein AAFW87_11450 [Pseudomonadota bacterium]